MTVTGNQRLEALAVPLVVDGRRAAAMPDEGGEDLFDRLRALGYSYNFV